MSELRKIRFIINPVSGIGKQKSVPGLIYELLSSSFEIEICYTERAGHASDLASEAAINGCYAVAIVGGDGSVNEAGRGLIGTETALAIIPTGSGNGLARHLKIPTKLADAINLLNNHSIRKIDTGKINDHVFLGVAGVGFDAEIAYQFSIYGRRGILSYMKIIAKSYLSYKRDQYSFSIPELEGQKAFLITVANSSQYGNRVQISPESKLDDGVLELCILHEIKWYQLFKIAMCFFNGTIHQTKYLKIVKGKKFKITKNETKGHVDGEPIDLSKECVFENVPQSLNVIEAK